MKKTLLNTLTFVSLFFVSTANAQVGIGVPAGDIHPSAELEVKSTEKGFLLPRMTKAQRIAIGSPATGLLIYQTDAVANNPTGLYFYDGTAWRNGLGVQGIKGDKGDTGAQGLQGQVGAQGQKGDAGLKGDRGDIGAQGLQGLPGAIGTKGDKGDRGETGAQGVQGDKGETGAIGPKGETGGGNGGFSHYIGEEFGGGVIFHLWKDKLGAEHGLVVATSDQSVLSQASPIFFSLDKSWSNIINVEIGQTAKSSWDGLSNSNAIVNQSGHTSSAAKLCLDLVSGGQDDWYLPSIQELNMLWNNYFTVVKSLSQISGAKELVWSSFGVVRSTVMLTALGPSHSTVGMLATTVSTA